MEEEESTIYLTSTPRFTLSNNQHSSHQFFLVTKYKKEYSKLAPKQLVSRLMPWFYIIMKEARGHAPSSLGKPLALSPK